MRYEIRYDCYDMSRPKRYETAAAKQKAYRERKRANEKFPVQVAEPDGASAGHAIPRGRTAGSNPATGVLPFGTKKVGELNMIVMPEETVEERSTMPVVKPKVFRDDFGNQLSEKQWEAWQEIKRKAKEKGYVKDEYSQ